MTRNISGSGFTIRQRGSGATGVKGGCLLSGIRLYNGVYRRWRKMTEKKMDVEKREEYGKAAGIRVEYL